MVPILPKMAWAQDYPTRPIRLVVGFPGGGSPDIVARLVGQALSSRLGQPIIIENKPGAGSNIATETVVRAKPDGYTLLLVLATNTINTTLYNNLNFNFTRDIAPIAGVMSVPNVLVVNPSVSAKSVLELIALAKSSPGKLNIANSGLGSTAHIAGDLFKMMTSTDMVNVPYHGNRPRHVCQPYGRTGALIRTSPIHYWVRQSGEATRIGGNKYQAFGFIARCSHC